MNRNSDSSVKLRPKKKEEDPFAPVRNDTYKPSGSLVDESHGVSGTLI